MMRLGLILVLFLSVVPASYADLITDPRLEAGDRQLALPREEALPRELRWSSYGAPMTFAPPPVVFVVQSSPILPVLSAPVVSASASVPEPSTILFLLTAMLAGGIGWSYKRLWRQP